MAYCTSCGAQLPEGAANCPICGSVIYEHVNQTNTPPQPQYTQPQGEYYQPPQEGNYYQPPYDTQQQNPYTAPQQQYGYNQVQNAQEAKNVSTAKTLGIIAIVFAFIRPLVSWICGGIGISKANSAIAFAQQIGNAQMVSEAENAKKFNKIGIILSIVLYVILIILIIMMVSLGVFDSIDYYEYY